MPLNVVTHAPLPPSRALHTSGIVRHARSAILVPRLSLEIDKRYPSLRHAFFLMAGTRRARVLSSRTDATTALQNSTNPNFHHQLLPFIHNFVKMSSTESTSNVQPVEAVQKKEEAAPAEQPRRATRPSSRRRSRSTPPAALAHTACLSVLQRCRAASCHDITINSL